MFTKVKIYSFLTISILLTGCAGNKFDMSVEPVIFGFERERIDVKVELNCDNVHRSSRDRVDIAPEFGCHAGNHDTVSLFIRADKQNKKRMAEMQLIWKEWSKDVYLNTGKREAFQMLAYLAKRFLGHADEKHLVKSMIDKTPTVVETEYVRFDYTLMPQKDLLVHMLTMTNKMPYVERKIEEKVLSAFPSKKDKTPEEILDELMAEDTAKGQSEQKQ